MSRRDVLRLIGGGMIAAATVPLTSCSSALPDEAIAAWRGPGEEKDVRRWILAHAILAPHSHNLQSWLVDLREPDVITLHMDLTRLLPETDPYSRQMCMSQGTFLELLDMAARERGLRASITLFPQGEFADIAPDKRPTARVVLSPDATVRPDPLFAQIFKRHTKREAYAPTTPTPSAIEAVVASCKEFPVRVGVADATDPTRLSRHREIAMAAWRVELVTPRTLLESYHWLRIGPAEIAANRDGISLNAPFLRVIDALGLFDRTKASAPDDPAITSQVDDFNAKIATTPAFFWMTTADNKLSTQVLAGRAYVRAQLAATAQGLAMHPLQQALQEYPEQAEHYEAIHSLLDARPTPGTVQMWARLGQGPTLGPAPRRGVAAHLL